MARRFSDRAPVHGFHCLVADRRGGGFALALPTRTNHNQGTSSDYDLPIFDKVVQYLKNDGRFDMGRIYTTGQSMGSVATIALAENRASQLAAVISSNASGPSRLSGGDAIPAGLVVGEGNYADRGIPGYTADTSYPEDDTSVLVRSTEAAAAGADIYWDAAKNLKGATNHNMNDWIAYFTDANGLGEDSLSDVIVYSGGNALNGGHDDAQGSLSDWESNNARYRTWKWYNEDDIPVMTYIFSLYEAHNCIPGFRPLMWDFLEHYSVETAADGTVTRYYSASGFEQDDAVVISDRQMTSGAEPKAPAPNFVPEARHTDEKRQRLQKVGTGQKMEIDGLETGY